MSNRLIIYFIICLLSFSVCKIEAQTFEDFCETNLTTITINTVNNELPTYEIKEGPYVDSKAIANATKVPCSITIRKRDQILYESGDYKPDTSGATIKIRGNSSALGVQKPYKIKLEKKADLLTRRDDDKYKDKEWILLKENQLKTYIGFTLSNLLDMPYKIGIKPVNLFINNEFTGLYYLTESIKRNEECRINVDKETGIIFEYDAYWWNEEYYIKSILKKNTYLAYTLKYPDAEKMTNSQEEYIEEWIEEMQKAVLDGRSEEYLCLDTCARWILAHDLLGNSDGVGTNLYFAKADNTPETKAYTPTLWDFDGAFFIKDDWSKTHCWGDAFFYYLFKNDTQKKFATAYCNQWISFTNNLVLNKLIDSLYSFASSEEGIAMEKSYILSEIKLNGKNSDWSLLSQIKKYEDWLINRQNCLNNMINEEFWDVMNSIETSNHRNIYKEKHTNEVFDILGRKTSDSYKGIKIINGQKYINKQ